MTNWSWGYIYWGIWIFGMFLIPELLAYFHEAPWPTLWTSIAGGILLAIGLHYFQLRRVSGRGA